MIIFAVEFDPLPGRGAAAIGQRLGAFDDEGLAPIIVGHFALSGAGSVRSGHRADPGEKPGCGPALGRRHRASRRPRSAPSRRLESRCSHDPANRARRRPASSRSSPTTSLRRTSTPSAFSWLVSHRELVSMRSGVSNSEPIAMISASAMIREETTERGGRRSRRARDRARCWWPAPDFCREQRPVPRCRGRRGTIRRFYPA